MLALVMGLIIVSPHNSFCYGASPAHTTCPAKIIHVAAGGPKCKIGPHSVSYCRFVG